MPVSQTTAFFGVVEGFYGRPWTSAQRRQLFVWMQRWGLNTYVYAPKDDLKHRARWRESYDARERRELTALIDQSCRRQVQFVYAIAPGLDVRYSAPGELSALKRKVEQVIGLGGRHFAILFDDIPARMNSADARRFGSVAAAQSWLTNELLDFVHARVRAPRLLFCPTPYCGRMAKPSVAGCAYLLEIGERLDPRIDVFWTGPEIVSETIPVESIRALQTVLRRPPVIWDNLFANDYDRRRIYLGPYSGRPLELRAHVRGILANPNCEFELNCVPLRTLALFARARKTWRPRLAYRQALTDWRPAFRSGGRGSVTRAELELLGDLFYLPFEFGARANQLLGDVRRLFELPPGRWGETYRRFDRTSLSILALLDKLTRIEDRALLGALYRHGWELKEEMILLRAYTGWLRTEPRRGAKFVCDEFQPKTYRGGLVAALQHLLPMDEAGRFQHRRTLP